MSPWVHGHVRDRAAAAARAEFRKRGGQVIGNEALSEAIGWAVAAALDAVKPADEQPTPERPAPPTEPGTFVLADPGEDFAAGERPWWLDRAKGWCYLDDEQAITNHAPGPPPGWRHAEVLPEGTAAALAEARRVLTGFFAEKDWTTARVAQSALDRMHDLDGGGAS